MSIRSRAEYDRQRYAENPEGKLSANRRWRRVNSESYNARRRALWAAQPMKRKTEQAERDRQRRLKRVFGITIADYEALLEKQEGRCAVCQKLPTGRRLAVDHDHAPSGSGLIRGLLCYSCNRALIGRRRSPLLFRHAAEYLENPPATSFDWAPVPTRKRKKRKQKRKKGAT